MTKLFTLCCQTVAADPTSGSPTWTYLAPIFSAIAAGTGIFLSYTVFKMQRQMTQRQLIVPLWQYISTLNEIDPLNPITPDIIKAVNTLELIAITCEGGMIDKSIIKRTFSNQFIKHYDNIKDCKSLPGFENKNGNDLIKENPATMNFYDELIIDLKNKNKIK
jgi:hypothetical protein